MNFPFVSIRPPMGYRAALVPRRPNILHQRLVPCQQELDEKARAGVAVEDDPT
jgi:hypothetical protein